MKYYIAGPMSGIPQYNFPAFFSAANMLREQGYEVVCPAEMDDEEDKGLAMTSPDGMGFTKKTWGDFLKRDVKLIADEVDGVVVLPRWFNSRGARLEVFVALTVQKPVFQLEEMTEMTPETLMRVISKFIVDQGDVSRYEENIT